ncbi:hypothetical protein J4438_04075 [Candidatus Woesearchaeota archaeon]|nr:hypothetical protein [Candidatus Woesearchaeota archaeon]
MIILDSDFLVNAVKYKIDVIEKIKEEYPELKIAVVDKTLDELKRIDILDSKLALKLIEIKKIEVIKTNKDKIADDLIFDIVKEKDIVATQDKEFKRRLKEKNIKVITIKQKKYIEI